MKKNFFNENNYCVVENAISKELASLSTVYCLFDEKNNYSPGDNQVSVGHSQYADSLMESMLIHLLPIIEENTGLSLSPTYSYYRVYRNGSTLLPHKDRESCEISATLCLGYNYDDSNGGWPIFIEDNGFVMQPGDMIIYKGIELNHYREKFVASEDIFHVQSFFHYVDNNGPYKNFIFDNREGIGIKNK